MTTLGPLSLEMNSSLVRGEGTRGGQALATDLASIPGPLVYGSKMLDGRVALTEVSAATLGAGVGLLLMDGLHVPLGATPGGEGLVAHQTGDPQPLVYLLDMGCHPRRIRKRLFTLFAGVGPTVSGVDVRLQPALAQEPARAEGAGDLLVPQVLLALVDP